MGVGKAIVCVLIIFIGLIKSLQGTHIVGGEVTYKPIGGDRYLVAMSMYIDCQNGAPGAIALEQQVNIGVFNADADTLMPEWSKLMNWNTPTRIVKLNYNCIQNAPNACVDWYQYEDTFYLPNRGHGYVLAFQRCCRNNTITNIVDPANTGVTYWTAIQYFNNTSAVFKELPPNFLCTNAPLVFDHSATDADGDSLSYELFQPFQGADAIDNRPPFTRFSLPPFVPLLWASGYSTTNQMDGSPKLTIDAKTGKLTVVPTQVGQFVVGIKVREYRGGILMGETLRDYQFNVVNCDFKVVAAGVVPQVNCNNEVKVTNNSQGANAYHWDFGDKNSTSDTSNDPNPTYQYSTSGTYTIRLVAKDGNCTDTAEIQATVLARIPLNKGFDTFFCSAEAIELSTGLDTPYAVQWSNGANAHQITVNQFGVFSVKVSVGVCESFDTFRISPIPWERPLMANVFTPNSDGINELFPDTGTMRNMRIWIYNRWGQMVFSNQYGEKGWDGKWKGIDSAEGPYFYQARFRTCEGKEEEWEGEVMLLRSAN